MKLIKKQKGITLIALVVTIVVLLILAGVSINAIIGDNGILKGAKAVQNKMEEAVQNDLDKIDGLNTVIGQYSGKTPKAPVDQSIQVTVDGTTGTTLTEQNIGQYLGKVVLNYKSGVTGTTESIEIGSTSYTVSTKYRLYWVDFDNKYGDGEGTIYLKADCTSNTYKLGSDTTSANAENVKIKNLNPALYAQGITSPTASNDNMKAVTWLTNTSNWEGLKDTSATISSKINYVVGSPSVEMMMDSYNTHYGLTGTTPDTSTLSAEANRVKLFYQYPYNGNTNNYGYGIGPSNHTLASNGYFWYTSDYSVKTDSAIDSMYFPGNNQWYWMASPSALNNDRVIYVSSSDNGNISIDFWTRHGDNHAFCPMVSLQSDVQLELEQ